MGAWGYHSDQNDDVADWICEFEQSDLSNLDQLRDEEILGIMVNYARVESADILVGSGFNPVFPTELPPNYPQSYKEFAVSAIHNIEEFGGPDVLNCSNPGKKIKAFNLEKKLFGL